MNSQVAFVLALLAALALIGVGATFSIKLVLYAGLVVLAVLMTIYANALRDSL